MTTETKTSYPSFAAFYPYYLSEHSNRTCRRLHFIGTSIGLALLLHALSTGNPWWLLVGVIQGYAWAWIGHFFFEDNRPATFKHPLYSFMGDWVMWKDMLIGKIKY